MFNKILHHADKVRRKVAFVVIAISIYSCNGEGSGTGNNNAAADTAPGVVTTPPHDTSRVVTPPPTNDSNAVVTDSLGTSR